MYRYKNYAKSSDYKRKKFETSAEFECTADVEENEMFDAMIQSCTNYIRCHDTIYPNRIETQIVFDSEHLRPGSHKLRV